METGAQRSSYQAITSVLNGPQILFQDQEISYRLLDYWGHPSDVPCFESLSRFMAAVNLSDRAALNAQLLLESWDEPSGLAPSFY